MNSPTVSTQDRHAGLQGFRLTSQMATAVGQPGQALPEGGVEPFDESGVDLPP